MTDPSDSANTTGELPDAPQRPRAVMRSRPEDFVVEEIPAYEASGEGEHLFVTFRKTSMTTLFAVRRIARALEVDERNAGFAGMKDRHAITTQTASFQLALDRDPTPLLSDLGDSELELLSMKRHNNKLKTGHLRGNRFTIRLREIEPAALPAMQRQLDTIGVEGVPNAFGPQRFGRDGDNPDRALAWLMGQARGPRGRKEQRMLFSALQSLLFNRVLDRRERDGNWNSMLPGDLAHKHESGGMFLVEGAELESALARAAAGEICPTGPMFGAKMRWPEGQVANIEREILEAGVPDPSRLNAFKRLGQGTRRPLRLKVAELQHDANATDGYLTVSFVLPKGGYATTVLSRICELIDQQRIAPRHASKAQG